MPPTERVDQDVLREEYAFLHDYGMSDGAIAERLGVTVDWLVRVVTDAPRRGGFKGMGTE